MTYKLKSDWVLFTSVALFVVSLGLLLFVFNKSEGSVPKEFFEARLRGSYISDNIVRLSSESIANLSEISQLDRLGNYKGGLELVLQEIPRNDEVKKEALFLSGELEKMAAEVTNIKPKEASDVAVQAIITESEIVKKLINYNDYVYGLLALLGSRFSNGETASETVVADFISKMNVEISSINDLNGEYKKLMLRFDSLIGSE